jgi:hypothetical protein
MAIGCCPSGQITSDPSGRRLQMTMWPGPACWAAAAKTAPIAQYEGGCGGLERRRSAPIPAGSDLSGCGSPAGYLVLGCLDDVAGLEAECGLYFFHWS